MMSRRIIFIYILLLMPLITNAATFYERKSEGWHWYENKKVLQQESKEDLEKQLIPTAQIELLKQELEQKLHAAIVKPTEENLISYMKLQKQIVDKSEEFSKSWQKVLYYNPKLDETTAFPVSNNARHIYLSEERKAKQEVIKKLSKEYGLFFFFKGSCPYCHSMAPLVKVFSQKYNWNILAVSLDRGVFPEFPWAKQDNGIAKNLNVTIVPALFAIHPTTKTIIPLAQGMISETEIEDRILLLMEIKK
jgi:conjugal transfer pilus assembly protein TraF